MNLHFKKQGSRRPGVFTWLQQETCTSRPTPDCRGNPGEDLHAWPVPAPECSGRVGAESGRIMNRIEMMHVLFLLLLHWIAIRKLATGNAAYCTPNFATGSLAPATRHFPFTNLYKKTILSAQFHK